MAAFPEPFTCGHRIYSTSGTDAFGNDIEAWAAPVTRAIYGVYPGTPGEDYEAGRDASTIPLFLIGSSDELGTVHARDRIVWQGDEFDVDGEPESYDFGPFGWAPGMRVRLLRVEG